MTWANKLGAALLAALLAGGFGAPVLAQNAAGDAAGPSADEESLQATTHKFNAYVGFMNRTLRAVQSLDRYKSWVNMKTGPTGHESNIYGLYSFTTRRARPAPRRRL
jgi:Protein of unknown function (DUF3829)